MCCDLGKRTVTGLRYLAARWVGAIAMVLALLDPGAATIAAAAQPNILVIMSDEHNAGVAGCYDNRIVRTPNIDRLAATGITFDAAYTNSPLCVPCRLSFTAGKYISRVGAWSNDCRLPSDEYPSIARLMTAAGYDAVLCGKMHYDGAHRYGFTEIGGNMNNHHMTGRGARRNPDDLTPLGTDGGGRFADFHPGDESSVIKHDRRVTAATTEFLSKRRSSDKPFFLLVGYIAPHFPLIVPQPYWDRYRDKVPMPQWPPGHLESLPLNYQHVRIGFKVTEPDPAVVKKGRELYYGLTEWMDNEVGQTLKALQEAGLADNTVVIYTTDHGECLGEHGMWWKNCMFDHAARVPMVISWPKRWPGGQRRAGACSLVDLVATIAELGGTRVPEDWDGDSLCAWMDDPNTEWKDLAISEYYAHIIASGFVMIRQGDWKYVYHTSPDDRHPAQRELYNLEDDPGEFRNRAAESSQAERIERMHARLVKELGEDPDVTEQRCRADYARGYEDRRPRQSTRP